MARRIGQRDVLWLSLLSGAFVLLAVQVFLGATSGFDRPHAGLFARLIEAPGIALGWGGAALCMVAIPYALVSWTRGRSPGKVLAVFGTLVCAVGVGGLAGVVASTPIRGGGEIGGYLARLLSDSLGSPIAFIVLLGIAIPGLLLALGPLILDTSPVGPGRPKGPEAKPWYPKPQVGDDGNEVPMQLAGTDVGPIRFRDATPEAPPVAPARAEAVPAARPKVVQPIAGVRYADGGDDEGPAIAEVADAPARAAEPAADDALPWGVRYAVPAASDVPEPSAPAEPADSAPVSLPEPEPEPVHAPVAVPAPEPVVAETAPPLAASPQESIASHRQKLSTSGVFERGRPGGANGGRPPQSKPKPAKPQSIRDALRGLFTNLPIDELPPARSGEPEEESPAPSRASPDAPGQLSLFGPSSSGPFATATRTAVAHPAAKDELFGAAVVAALERGTASLVLLKRRLNVGYSRAASLMEALVAEGILGEMTASGSRPTLMTVAEWEKRKKR